MLYTLVGATCQEERLSVLIVTEVDILIAFTDGGGSCERLNLNML